MEARLRMVEDKLEIYNIIASHPPSADSGHGDAAAAIFVDDGIFDFADGRSATGKAAIGAVVESADHHQAIATGLAHFAGLPLIRLAGDVAHATSYLQIITPDHTAAEKSLPNHGPSSGYRIHRTVVNRWTLVRTPEGWRVTTRRVRPLDGTPPALEIVEQATADAHRLMAAEIRNGTV